MNKRLNTPKNPLLLSDLDKRLTSKALWKDMRAPQSWKIFIHFVYPALMAVFMLSALSSCTMVSKEMLPGVEYRENPRVEIIEYDDYAKLQNDCANQFKEVYLRFSGCSSVPHDPQEKCIIRVMAGDEKTKKHELAHCHGHADTLLPWMVDFNFYDTH
jgi:hypothetical protein